MRKISLKSHIWHVSQSFALKDSIYWFEFLLFFLLKNHWKRFYLTTTKNMRIQNKINSKKNSKSLCSSFHFDWNMWMYFSVLQYFFHCGEKKIVCALWWYVHEMWQKCECIVEFMRFFTIENSFRKTNPSTSWKEREIESIKLLFAYYLFYVDQLCWIRSEYGTMCAKLYKKLKYAVARVSTTNSKKKSTEQ